MTHQHTQHDNPHPPQAPLIPTSPTLSLWIAMPQTMVVHCISITPESIQSSLNAHSGIAVQLDQIMEEQSMHMSTHFRSSTQHSQIVHLEMLVVVFMQIQSKHVFHSEHVCLKIVKLFTMEVEYTSLVVQQIMKYV